MNYLQPWKLVTLAIGIGILIFGSYYYQFQDWDVGISVIMATLAYIFAPMLVKAIWLRDWKSLPLQILAAWFSIDLIYVWYNEAMGHWYIREENFYASLWMYLICGVIWVLQGPLTSLALPKRQASRARLA